MAVRAVVWVAVAALALAEGASLRGTVRTFSLCIPRV
jgi:hypothetical protein